MAVIRRRSRALRVIMLERKRKVVPPRRSLTELGSRGRDGWLSSWPGNGRESVASDDEDIAVEVDVVKREMGPLRGQVGG